MGGSFLTIHPPCDLPLLNAALIVIQQLAEPLEMHHLALTQEADNLVHVLVVGQAQDIIVRRPGFLLCCHILDNVRNWITLHLEIRRRKRDSAGVRRPNSVGVINIIIRLAVLVEAPRALTVRQLPYYAADYLKVRKLLGAYRSNGNVPYPEKR